ncbi:MAG: hypothetical protein ACU0BF_00280 [Paracoccaceae bacterium]
MPAEAADPIAQAVAAGDKARVARLYADAARGAGPQEAAFLLTQAYVWALDAGAAQAEELRRRLAEMGRL